MKSMYGLFLNYYQWKKKKYMKEILGFRDLEVDTGGNSIYFLEKNPEKINHSFDPRSFGFRNGA